MTPEQIRLARLMRQDEKSYREIGDHFGLAGESVRLALNEKSERRSPIKETESERNERRQKAREMRRAGASLDEIAEALDVSRSYASRIVSGVEKPKKEEPAAQNIEAIKADYLGGMNRVEIAKKFAVPLWAVRKLTRGMKEAQKNETKEGFELRRDDIEARINERNQRLLMHRARGRTIAELAYLFTLSERTVSEIIQKAVQRGEVAFKPSRHPRGLVGEERIAHLRSLKERNQRVIELRRQGLNSKTIGERVGLMPKTVANICRQAGVPFSENIDRDAHVRLWRSINAKPERGSLSPQERAQRAITQRQRQREFRERYVVDDEMRGLTRQEAAYRSRKKRLHEMLTRDVAGRKPAPITLPRISIQHVDL